LAAINNVYTSSLEKKLDFKWLAIRKTYTTLVATGLIPILLATLFGMKHYALLIGLFAREILDFLILMTRQRATFRRFSLSDLKMMYSDFLSISFSAAISKTALNGDYILVSKFLGASQMGLYTKAYQLMAMPVTLVGDALQKIGFASTADRAQDIDLLRKMTVRLLYLAIITVLPVSLMLFFSARLIIFLALGESWLEIVPAFQILVFGTTLRLAYKVPATLLSIQRKFKLVLLSQILYASSILVFGYLLIGHGTEGVGLAVLISLFIQFVAMTWFLERVIHFGLMKFLKSILGPSLVIFGGFFLAQYFSSFIHTANPYLLDLFSLAIFVISSLIAAIFYLKFSSDKN
ncbi:MAG: oligosaccharide flippase family protein, partial [Fulvivirga sp.]